MPSSSSRHLVVDARTVRLGATGVGRYTAGLIAGLDRIAGAAGWRVTALRLAGSARGESSWPGSFWESLRHVEIHDVPFDYEDHPGGDLWLQFSINGLMRLLAGRVLLSPAFIGPIGPRAFGRVLVIHDSIAWDAPGNLNGAFGSYLRKMTRWSAAWADRVVTVSPPAREGIARHGLAPRHRIDVVPNGVDRVLFHPAAVRTLLLPDGRSKEAPLVVYVGSFEKRKNHGVLIEALRREPLASRGARLVFIHRATSQEKSAMMRRARGLDIRVRAPATPAEIAEWMRAADAVAFPSKMEGFGVPALEALASGTPLVAADIPAMRWLTGNGKCARLVAPDDPAAWSRTIAEVLVAGSDRADARVRAGMARAAQFTWERSARRLLALLRD